MKLFNLTDIPTPLLLEKQLVNKVLVAGRALVEPGQSVMVGEDELLRRDLLPYTACGAMAVDVLPPQYAVAKLAQERATALQAKRSAPKEERTRGRRK